MVQFMAEGLMSADVDGLHGDTIRRADRITTTTSHACGDRTSYGQLDCVPSSMHT